MDRLTSLIPVATGNCEKGSAARFPAKLCSAPILGNVSSKATLRLSSLPNSQTVT